MPFCCSGLFHRQTASSAGDKPIAHQAQKPQSSRAIAIPSKASMKNKEVYDKLNPKKSKPEPATHTNQELNGSPATTTEEPFWTWRLVKVICAIAALSASHAATPASGGVVEQLLQLIDGVGILFMCVGAVLLLGVQSRKPLKFRHTNKAIEDVMNRKNWKDDDGMFDRMTGGISGAFANLLILPLLVVFTVPLDLFVEIVPLLMGLIVIGLGVGCAANFVTNHVDPDGTEMFIVREVLGRASFFVGLLYGPELVS